MGKITVFPLFTQSVHYYYYIHLTAFFQDKLGKLAP